MSHATESLAELEARLEKGWQMIEGQSSPVLRKKFEDHWFKLLRVYEQRCDAAREYREGGGHA